MIEVNDLHKSYGKHKVLKGINLKVKKGEVYGFLGRNGAGKSTTMNILTGLIKFDDGKCLVNNIDVKNISSMNELNVGYLPESPSMYPYLNAWEYLDYIAACKKSSKYKVRSRSEEILELVGLKEAAKRRIGGYSRGMKQRVGMAAVLYHNPEVIFLDEPSSALDPEGRKDMIDIITYLKNEGKTVFLSTHIISDVERVCNRIGILNNGKLVYEDTLDNILKEYSTPVYDIEFENEISTFKLDKISNHSFIEKFVLNNKKLSIFVKPEENVAVKTIELIGTLGMPIPSYNLRKANVEDIFLKFTDKGVGENE